MNYHDNRRRVPLSAIEVTVVPLPVKPYPLASPMTAFVAWHSSSWTHVRGPAQLRTAENLVCSRPGGIRRKRSDKFTHAVNGAVTPEINCSPVS